MMDRYQVTGDFYLHPTPAGAYYAVSRNTPEVARGLLQRLLQEPETPRLSAELLQEWTGLNEHDALELVYRLQASSLLQGLSQPQRVPHTSMETMLPPLLEKLSDEGRAVLAERRGLQLGATGFAHEVVEELAALGAELAGLQQRHAGLLANNLRVRAEGWGMVSASGYCEIGFWPMYLGDEYFTLVVSGLPQFNQDAFTQLAWVLGVRYGRALDPHSL